MENTKTKEPVRYLMPKKQKELAKQASDSSNRTLEGEFSLHLLNIFEIA
jgi:hypothetical protein